MRKVKTMIVPLMMTYAAWYLWTHYYELTLVWN